MKMIYTIKSLGSDKWLVKGHKWNSCYCDKIPFEVILTQTKRPCKRDVMNYLHLTISL